MSIPFPEPTTPVASRAEVFLGYLDYFRASVIAKLEGLAPHELRHSRLPSGWTPLELLKHLIFVEMRWIEWGFEGRTVDDPWGISAKAVGAWNPGRRLIPWPRRGASGRGIRAAWSGPRLSMR